MINKLLIEGWKNYVHSYSIVNIYQMVALTKISSLQIYFKEVPGYREDWPRRKVQDFILDETDQEILDNKVLPYDPKLNYDFIFRISYPFDLSYSQVNLKTMKHIPIILFYTSEFKSFKDSDFINGTSKTFVEDCISGRILPVTPSNWSAEVLVKQGFQPLVIPHGVDTRKFYPMKETAFRTELGIPTDAFVFLNVSAMTGNKNIKGIIKAFYNLRILMKDSFLVLKGLEGLYSCEAKINSYLKELIKEEGLTIKEIASRIIYVPDTFDYNEMNQLYNICDCYISPYLAEGFNIPVLDALACGKPVIVSKGGPTDDFTTIEFAKYPVTVNMTINEKDSILVVENVSLQNCMYSVYNDVNFRDNVKNHAPTFVKKFSWDTAATQIAALCRMSYVVY
jgi:glycosyltransferase involved in cell wall biosynthesis